MTAIYQPPIAKPKAVRHCRADRLPDDVIAHHEAVLEAWFRVSDDRSRREGTLRIAAVDVAVGRRARLQDSPREGRKCAPQPSFLASVN
jgi:hypothetical protein